VTYESGRKRQSKDRERSSGRFLLGYGVAYYSYQHSQGRAEMRYITAQDMEVVDRVLNDIRREFPVKEAIDYEDKIQQIVSQKVWDVLANLQDVYEEEVDFTLNELASKYREAPEKEDE
jgi:hypothetical protein